MSQRYFARIGYSGDSQALIEEIISDYDLGRVKGTKVLEVGYEDCNVAVTTDNGKFVIKAFGSFREPEEINRYVEIMVAVNNAGINYPGLHMSNAGQALFKHKTGIRSVVMDFIDGETYFDTKTIPTDAELDLVMAEAVKVHNLSIKPSFLFDSWAIPHIHKMYERTAQFLDGEGKRLVGQAIKIYDAIDKQKLTTRFVHGDIISTNTLKGLDSKVWILDFAVANVYPKIQELAVIASSLMSTPDNFTPLYKRVEKVKKSYLGAGGKLSDYEQQVLFDNALAGAAMEYMGGHKTKFIDNEKPEESDYWIKLGKKTLQEALK